MDTKYSTIDMYDSLIKKYPKYIKPEIIAIVMIQSSDGVWLEVVESTEVFDGLEKQVVARISLDFITDEENQETGEVSLMFSPDVDIEVNARKFIEEMTPYDIINTLDIFDDLAAERISRKYNNFGVND